MPQKRGDAYETAQRLGHVPIIENDLVQEELDSLETKEVDPEHIDFDEHTTPLDDLPDEGNDPEYLISIDGSNQEVPTDDQYPSNRIAFIQIAAVLTRLDLLEEQDSQSFVDPAQVEKLDETGLQDIVLPSSNYVHEEAETVLESWRLQIYNTFKSRKIENKTLLEILMEVSKEDPRYVSDDEILVYRCPNPDCESNGNRIDILTHIEELGECDICGTQTYPTDALRTHERVSGTQSNGAAIGAIRQVLEHLTMCAYLNYLSQNHPERLSRVGFVIDGPLAIYDTPSWLHSAILQNIYRVYDRQREAGFEPPIIVGVEKSGQFKDHAENIDRKLNESTLLHMDNEYIYNHIKSGTTDNEYGEREHYGWPFIYKSNSGRLFVLKIPMPTEGEKYDPMNYPLMKKTLESIENVETALYDDATIPITLAHQRASIPLDTGSRVLELFSQDPTDTP